MAYKNSKKPVQYRITTGNTVMINSQNKRALQDDALTIINEQSIDESTFFTPIAKNAFINTTEVEATLWFIQNQSDIFSVLKLIAVDVKELSVLDMMLCRINTHEAISSFNGIHIDRLASLLLKEQSYYGHSIDKDLDKVAKLSAELIVQYLLDRFDRRVQHSIRRLDSQGK